MKPLLQRLLKLLGYAWKGGPLDGWKSYLGFLLYVASKTIPGFPLIDLGQGITPEMALMLWGILDKYLKQFGWRK